MARHTAILGFYSISTLQYYLVSYEVLMLDSLCVLAIVVIFD